MKRIVWIALLAMIPTTIAVAGGEDKGKETDPVASASKDVPVPSTSANNKIVSPIPILDETEDFVGDKTHTVQQTDTSDRSHMTYDIKQQSRIPLNPHFKPISWQEKLCKWFIPGYFPAASFITARPEPREFVEVLGNSMRQLTSFTTKLRNLIVAKSIINGLEAGFIASKLLPRSPHKNILATSLGLVGCGVAYWLNKRMANRLVNTPADNQNTFNLKNYMRKFNNATAHGEVLTEHGIEHGQAVIMPMLKSELNIPDNKPIFTAPSWLSATAETRRTV